MNAGRGLMLLALICAACSLGAEAPVEVRVVEAPDLLMDVPARLLLDVWTGEPTAGVELAVEGDEGLRVVDYAPRVLPATHPEAGSQLFVDLVPKSRGNWILTVRLTLHMGGDRLTRAVTLPFEVSSPPTVRPIADEFPGLPAPDD